LDDAHGENHERLIAQFNALNLFASVFTFHGVNLPKATLSEDEAGRILEIILPPNSRNLPPPKTFHP
jgi:hypothetical protein